MSVLFTLTGSYYKNTEKVQTDITVFNIHKINKIKNI